MSSIEAPTKEDNLHWLDLSIWPAYVGFCSSEEDYFGFLEELDIDDDFYMPDTADACVKSLDADGRLCLLVCIKPERFKPYSQVQRAGLLAHEVVHVIQGIRERIGDIGAEGEAYTMQRILMALVSWEKNVRKGKHGSPLEKEAVLDWEPEESSDPGPCEIPKEEASGC